MSQKIKRIAISQSNYIPWKGYFDSIAEVDCVVLYDDMQYTKRDWRNRNKIKTEHGLKWLTIPVQAKGKYLQKINETVISDSEWKQKHLLQLKQAYRKARCFQDVFPWVEKLYLSTNFQMLSEINNHFITETNKFLGIETRIRDSREFTLVEGKTERLVGICKELGATEYHTGLAAKAYIDETLFDREGIVVKYFDYSGYSEYPQLFGDFEHGVSILDVIFNMGKDAKHQLKNI